MLVFEKNLEKHVTMKVFLREDKKYQVQFLAGGHSFGFLTDQIEAVADRLAALDGHFAMEHRAKQYELDNLKKIDDLF